MIGDSSIFKISFAVDKRLYYDGYLILRNSGEIVGYTDEGLLYGNSSSIIIEVSFQKYEDQMKGYEVDDIFERMKSKNILECRKNFNESENGKREINLRLKKFNSSDPENKNIYINIKRIEERIRQKEERFPKGTIEQIKKTYLN